MHKNQYVGEELKYEICNDTPTCNEPSEILSDRNIDEMLPSDLFEENTELPELIIKKQDTLSSEIETNDGSGEIMTFILDNAKSFGEKTSVQTEQMPFMRYNSQQEMPSQIFRTPEPTVEYSKFLISQKHEKNKFNSKYLLFILKL